MMLIKGKNFNKKRIEIGFRTQFPCLGNGSL